MLVMPIRSRFHRAYCMGPSKLLEQRRARSFAYKESSVDVVKHYIASFFSGTFQRVWDRQRSLNRDGLEVSSVKKVAWMLSNITLQFFFSGTFQRKNSFI